jgi:hypothetical protein
MNSCNQTRFTTTNIENGQLSDLVGTGKDRAQLNKRTKLILFHQSIPMLERRPGIGMLLCKLIQPFPCNDVHWLSLRRVFENVRIAYYVIVLRTAPNGSRFSRCEANRVFQVKAPGNRLLQDDRQVQRCREWSVVSHPHSAQTQCSRIRRAQILAPFDQVVVVLVVNRHRVVFYAFGLPVAALIGRACG